MKTFETRLDIICQGYGNFQNVRSLMVKEFGVTVSGTGITNDQYDLHVVTRGQRKPATSTIDNYRMFLRGVLAALYHTQDVAKL